MPRVMWLKKMVRPILKSQIQGLPVSAGVLLDGEDVTLKSVFFVELLATFSHNGEEAEVG